MVCCLWLPFVMELLPEQAQLLLPLIDKLEAVGEVSGFGLMKYSPHGCLVVEVRVSAMRWRGGAAILRYCLR